MNSNNSFFLGADVGGTSTRLAISDQSGRVVGYGQAGPGNHEGVGYGGLTAALRSALQQALPSGIPLDHIAGAGFGIGGFDFPSETQLTLEAISGLGLNASVKAVNDAEIGLLAGSPEGWGVAVVSGTGCNCRGRDASHQRTGRVTGHGSAMGEGAGASELIDQAVKVLARQWTKREAETHLARIFVEYCRARSLEDLVEGLTLGWYEITADAAPLIFAAAEAGDPAACGLIEWAGDELGELARAVIRQLDFQNLAFDVVMIGSMFEGGRRLIEPMQRSILAFAPRARFIRLQSPPVMGALLLGMEAARVESGPEVRLNLEQSLRKSMPERGR